MEPGALPAMGPAASGHPDQLQARAIASTARYTVRCRLCVILLLGLGQGLTRVIYSLPQLLVAGAGTGKTRVLAARAAHLVQTGKARPEEVRLTG